MIALIFTIALSSSSWSFQACINEYIQNYSFRAIIKSKFYRLNSKKRKILEQVLGEATDPDDKLRILNIILDTRADVLSKYISIPGDANFNSFIKFIKSPMLKGELPALSNKGDYQLFYRLLNGEIDGEVRAFAHFNYSKFKGHNKFLKKLLKRIRKARSDENILVHGDDNSVSYLWYPKYPGSETSNATHAKILVEGRVIDTMGDYTLAKPRKIHQRLAKNSKKDQYFEFKVETSPEEMEKIKYLINNNDRRGTGLGSCVHSACGAMSKSGVMTVPFPFNQVPSLAALYLSLRRLYPLGKKISIKFHGTNASNSLNSPDIMVDGIIVGLLTLGGYGINSARNHIQYALSSDSSDKKAKSFGINRIEDYKSIEYILSKKDLISSHIATVLDGYYIVHFFNFIKKDQLLKLEKILNILNISMKEFDELILIHSDYTRANERKVHSDKLSTLLFHLLEYDKILLKLKEHNKATQVSEVLYWYLNEYR